jgi:hypothetical protein
MNAPRVSVVIPAYGGADFLAEAVQSVLDQTYTHLELIVVDDASPDSTGDVIRQFADPRLKYILHETNQGAVAARQTGVGVSSGEIIAFLDQDDLYHPEKLQTHVDFLQQHPEIGFTYNARFRLESTSRDIRAIVEPLQSVTLTDLVLGFPFTPSDWVLRRRWALREEIWDQSYVLHGQEAIFNGGEIIFCGRLALAGCQFGNVGRALNYRRIHPSRVLSNLAGRCKAERTCQEVILNDPRCPEEVKAVRDRAFTNTYLVFAYYALAQEETALGQSFVREAVRLNPSLVAGEPCPLVSFLATQSAVGGGLDMERHLQKIFDQLPPDMKGLSTQLKWAVGRGYLIWGTRAMLWNRYAEGRQALARAASWGASLDERFIQTLTHQLVSHQRECGAEATQEAIQNMAPDLEKVGGRRSVRRLKGCYSVNRAFQSYRAGEYALVPGRVVHAVRNDPTYLLNRGVLSILMRSLVGPRPRRDAQ